MFFFSSTSVVLNSLKEIDTFLVRLDYFQFTNIKIINLAIRWQENTDRKKSTSVASLNQLVQREKKTMPILSQKDRICFHDAKLFFKYTLTRCEFVRFNHEVKLATGFLITLFFNRKNHVSDVTFKMKLVVTCQLTFIRFEFYVKLTLNKEVICYICIVHLVVEIV
jgi:hypothetical protein